MRGGAGSRRMRRIVLRNTRTLLPVVRASETIPHVIDIHTGSFASIYAGYSQLKRSLEKDLVSGKRCRIRIPKSLYVNRIAKEPIRCTTLWSYAKNVGLHAVDRAFQYDANISLSSFYNVFLLSITVLFSIAVTFGYSGRGGTGSAGLALYSGHARRI